MKSKMHAGAERGIYQKARDLRNRSTPAEEVLWGYLKTKPYGFKFRRQHPYSIFILDFYCHALKLVIEVDGCIHDLEKVKVNDQQRQGLLEKDGLFVLRFTNEEVRIDIAEVIKKLEDQITHSIPAPKGDS